jgi:magnesium chelatase family protein
MNPCRCGMAGGPGHSCARGPRCASDYQARISGPLMDRIDIRIDVPAVSAADLIRPSKAETSAEVAARVARAREMQRGRYRALGAVAVAANAQCPTALIEEVAAVDAGARALLSEAAEKMAFSARAYHRILKVARTLADLRSRWRARRGPHPSRRGDLLPRRRQPRRARRLSRCRRKRQRA